MKAPTTVKMILAQRGQPMGAKSTQVRTISAVPIIFPPLDPS